VGFTDELRPRENRKLPKWYQKTESARFCVILLVNERLLNKERIHMTNPEALQRKPRCQHITKSGQPCHADPQTGKDWCFMHDPEKKQQQAEAQKHGGEARTRQVSPEIKLPPDLPVVKLETAGSVYDLMFETVHHLHCGKMDTRSAKALAYLSALLLRCLKAGQRHIALLLSDTINKVRLAEIDLNTAKTVGHLASIMLIAMKQEAEEHAALQPAEPARLAPTAPSNSLAMLARHLGIESVPISLDRATAQDDHKLHPAAIAGVNGAANASAASQSLSS
jgi:hypothetical protein